MKFTWIDLYLASYARLGQNLGQTRQPIVRIHELVLIDLGMRLLTMIGLKYYETTSLHRQCLEGSRKCIGFIRFAAVSLCRNAVGRHDGKIQKPRISFASLGSHFWDLSKFGSTTPSLNAWFHLLTCIRFRLDTYILTLPFGLAQFTNP